jgi:aspartate/methionine/tyrosine aminotransferase
VVGDLIGILKNQPKIALFLGQWIVTKLQPNEALFRIAEETGIVLLPGRGFGGKEGKGRSAKVTVTKPVKGGKK